MTSSAIARDIDDALTRQGLSALRLVPISPAGDRKRGRCAYRAETEGGRILKLRWFESSDAAERLVALRSGLESAFAPVIARHGPVIIEEWIEGTFLTAPAADRYIETAGGG